MGYIRSVCRAAISFIYIAFLTGFSLARYSSLLFMQLTFTGYLIGISAHLSLLFFKFVYLVWWGLYLALSLVSGHAAAARLVTRKSYLLEPLPAPAPASAHGFGFTRHSTDLHEATLLCIFRVMPTFFNLPNSGSAEWAATYAIIHICHTRADQTRPDRVSARLGLAWLACQAGRLLCSALVCYLCKCQIFWNAAAMWTKANGSTL